jgi:hypothetical protein
METATEAVAVIETVALADAVDCATLCAVTLTELEGTVAGAIYKPDEEIVPTVEFPPTTPFTSQLRPVLGPVTDAVNCCDCPTCRAEEVGDMVTLIEPFPPRWFPFPADAADKQNVR